MILIEIKKEARYLKKNSQTPQKKNCENLSAIIFTNVSKVELGKLVNFFETHDIISTIWVDNRVLWVWPNIGPFRP